MCGSECKQNPAPLIVLVVNHLIILAILAFSMVQVAGKSEHRDVFMNVLSLIIGVYIPSPNLRRSGVGGVDTVIESSFAASSGRTSAFSRANAPPPYAGTPQRATSYAGTPHRDNDGIQSGDETE